MSTRIMLSIDKLNELGEVYKTTSQISQDVMGRIQGQVSSLKATWEGQGAEAWFSGISPSMTRLEQFFQKSMVLGKNLTSFSAEMKAADQSGTATGESQSGRKARVGSYEFNTALRQHDTLVEYYDQGPYGNQDGVVDENDTIGMNENALWLYNERLSVFGDQNGDGVINHVDREIRGERHYTPEAILYNYDQNDDGHVNGEDYPDSWMLNPSAYGAGGASGGGASTGGGNTTVGTGSTYTPTSSSDYYYAYLNSGSGSGSSSTGGTPSVTPATTSVTPATQSTQGTSSYDYYYASSSGSSSSGGGTPSITPTSSTPSSTPATQSSDYY